MSQGKSYICRDCAKHSLLESKCQECNSPRILKLDDLLSLKIAHIDCDAFYASVEKSQNPHLINKPVIVGGGQRGVVTTCCYIARIKGIKSAMPIFKAKKLCPEAIIIPPRMSLYKHISNLIFKKFYQLTPSVETIAFDEAYLDFSGTYQLFKKTPAELLVKLAIEIEKELNITVSIGLSENKFLSKLASSFSKPKGFTVIRNSEKSEFLKKLHIKNIPGIGPKFQKKLEKNSIVKIEDIVNQKPEVLLSKFGKYGLTIWNLAKGIDERKVEASSVRKSISKETTFETDVSDLKILKKTLWILAEEVSEILKNKNILAKSLTQTFKEPTILAEYLYQVAISLLKKRLELIPFRLIGISTSKFSFEKQETFTNFNSNSKLRKIERTEYAMDKIRQKFGKQIIKKGRALN